jgi:hypothetical protein
MFVYITWIDFKIIIILGLSAPLRSRRSGPQKTRDGLTAMIVIKNRDNGAMTHDLALRLRVDSCGILLINSAHLGRACG